MIRRIQGNRPEPIAEWDWPRTRWVPDGYDQKRVPTIDEDNFQLLAERYNDLVEVVTFLVDRAGIKFADD